MQQKSKSSKLLLPILAALLLCINSRAENGKSRVDFEALFPKKYVYTAHIVPQPQNESSFEDIDTIIMDAFVVRAKRYQLTTEMLIGDHGLALVKISKPGLSIDSFVSAYAWQAYRDYKRLTMLNELDKLLHVARIMGDDSDISELNYMKSNIRYRKFDWRVNSIDKNLNGRTR